MQITPLRYIWICLLYLLQVSFYFGLPLNADEDKWSFIVLADWHNAEYFATNPGEDTENWRLRYEQIRNIKQTYGGDLVVLPGDSNSGRWDTKEFAKKYKPELTVNERILQAGRNCYGTMRNLFKKAGYDKILMAVGDHELGDNDWPLDSAKVQAIGQYRAAFVEGFNIDPATGEHMFTNPIGSAPSRPLETPYRSTSYAHQHKNVLIITVDAFHQKKDKFINVAQGLGGHGVITCTVEGEHLIWFENVLIEANNDDSIKHIIVQAHLPIIQPVRKVSCSGQFMDYGEESNFWKTMVKYNVDIYFAGEVHSNTVTKDPDSNLLQIVSRGNSFNNFLKVDVTNYSLNVTAYNEIGVKPRYNNNYRAYGNLIVNKSTVSYRSGKKSMISDVPTTIFTRRQVNTIACGSGSSKDCGSSPPVTVSQDVRYPVRCCSNSIMASPKTKKNDKTCPFAASCFNESAFDSLYLDMSDNKSCHDAGLCSGPLLYEQAEALCVTVGGYICTIEDLANDCAKSTGCQGDNTFVWAKKLESGMPPAIAPTSDQPTTMPYNVSPNTHTISCGSGSSKTCGFFPPVAVSHDTKFPVKCCSYSSMMASPNIIKHDDNLCPFAASCFYESVFHSVFDSLSLDTSDNKSCQDVGLCSGPLPYEQAEALCAAAGGNICTIEELANDCAKSTGCRSDNLFVWTGETQEPPCDHICSSGVLELLNRTSALVHFNFEDIVPLKSRQVIGMEYVESRWTLVGKRIKIQGVDSTESIPNQGSFGQPYDAQVIGVKLVHDGLESCGTFTKKSKLGIYATGPHGAGSKISYSIRIKTKKKRNMILVHYGHVHGFGMRMTRNMYTLTLDKTGTPKLYIDNNSVLEPQKIHNLNDGKWHDIAVSMPNNSCALSEVVMYVDGEMIDTIMPQNNKRIFFVTSGRTSIGGFGYSHNTFKKLFPALKSFAGKISEFYMWGRSIGEDDLK